MLVQQVGLASAIRLRFGPFELNIAERSLRRADQVIPLGGRAYDILIALLENAGEVVSKADLIANVWPEVMVEEGSLRVHLSALRKALGDGQFGNKYIASTQGHGYSFIAPFRGPRRGRSVCGIVQPAARAGPHGWSRRCCS
jgi:DNA-binding winged helix-turn-helix (wHTH) protein